MGTVKEEGAHIDPDEEGRQSRIAIMPPLSSVYNLLDFESIARRVMKKNAWAYYSSGADDEIVRAVTLYWKRYTSANRFAYRLCEKTILHSIKLAFALALWSTLDMLTYQRPCLVSQPNPLSMSPQRPWGNLGILKARCV